MSSFSIQVPSMDTLTCQQFENIFSEGRRSSLITTNNNGRTYHVTWEASTDTISVKRDLANVNCWTKFSEVLELRGILRGEKVGE